MLTSHTPFIWAPAFSPDGREVAFSRAEVDGSWHVWTIPTEGGAPKRITATSHGEVYPRYGPDGSFILFHTWGSPRRIGHVARDGGRLTVAVRGCEHGVSDMSPDGRWIAMTRTDRDAERIYIAAATGGEPRAGDDVTGIGGEVVARRPLDRLRANRGYNGGIFVIRPDGSDERRLTKRGLAGVVARREADRLSRHRRRWQRGDPPRLAARWGNATS